MEKYWFCFCSSGQNDYAGIISARGVSACDWGFGACAQGSALRATVGFVSCRALPHSQAPPRRPVIAAEIAALLDSERRISSSLKENMSGS